MNHGDRMAGGVLAGAAAMSVLAMAHHPAGLGSAIGLGQWIHAIMITLVALMAYGFTHAARRMGLDRPAVLMGLVAYGIALFADVGAATINGFALAGLVAQQADRGLFVLAWELNQALAGLGVVAAGAAFLLWSSVLVRTPGWSRAIGALGLAAGLVPALGLVGGHLSMNVHGALILYAVHAVWTAAMGLYLWSGRFAADRS